MTEHEILQTLDRLLGAVRFALQCRLVPQGSQHFETWQGTGQYDFRVGEFLIKDLKSDTPETEPLRALALHASQNTLLGLCCALVDRQLLEIVEGFLAGLDEDQTQVALLIGQNNLRDLIFSLDGYSGHPVRKTRCTQLAADLRGLMRAAYGEIL